ncbi:MAG: hypothetical protein AB1758_38530 [Candidatus Eremiobacterota bacterium]
MKGKSSKGNGSKKEETPREAPLVGGILRKITLGDTEAPAREKAPSVTGLLKKAAVEPEPHVCGDEAVFRMAVVEAVTSMAGAVVAAMPESSPADPLTVARGAVNSLTDLLLKELPSGDPELRAAIAAGAAEMAVVVLERKVGAGASNPEVIVRGAVQDFVRSYRDRLL